MLPIAHYAHCCQSHRDEICLRFFWQHCVTAFGIDQGASDSAQWLAAEDDGMESVVEITVIGRTAYYHPSSIIAIATMCVYALKWTLVNTIER